LATKGRKERKVGKKKESINASREKQHVSDYCQKKKGGWGSPLVHRKKRKKKEEKPLFQKPPEPPEKREKKWRVVCVTERKEKRMRRPHFPAKKKKESGLPAETKKTSTPNPLLRELSQIGKRGSSSFFGEKKKGKGQLVIEEKKEREGRGGHLFFT